MMVIFFDEFSYSKNLKLKDTISPTYKKYFSNSLIKNKTNLVANNRDIVDFCKDFSSAKSIEMNLFPEQFLELYDECLIKGLPWMKRYERNKSSKKKSIEQILIEQEENKREAKERSILQEKYLRESYENKFDDFFR